MSLTFISFTALFSFSSRINYVLIVFGSKKYNPFILVHTHTHTHISRDSFDILTPCSLYGVVPRTQCWVYHLTIIIFSVLFHSPDVNILFPLLNIFMVTPLHMYIFLVRFCRNLLLYVRDRRGLLLILASLHLL